VMVVASADTATVTVSDSKSNTWTGLHKQDSGGIGGIVQVQTYYVAGPTVGTGHTFTVSGTGAKASIAVSAWYGVPTTTPFDAEAAGGSSNVTTANTLSAGTCSSATANELFIGGFAGSSASADTNADLTVLENVFYSANNYSVALGYLVYGSSGSLSATWTHPVQTSGSGQSAVCSSFKHQ
jgi:hypothetical protein